MNIKGFLRDVIRGLTCILAIYIAPPTQAQDLNTIQDYITDTDEVDFSGFANLWWQWVYGMPASGFPPIDLARVNCASQGADGIWFLMNSDSPQVVERTCELPLGSSVFFPVISNLVFSPPLAELTCDKAKDLANFERNLNYIMTVKLNGVAIRLDDRNLVGSLECFDLLARIPSEQNPPSYFPSATDGYWFMFNPLPVGSHKLEILVQYDDIAKNEIRTLMNVHYQLTVNEQ